MIWQRKRGVTNLRREGLNQVGGDGAVNQAHKENLNENQQHQHGEIGIRGFLDRDQRTGGVRGHSREPDRTRYFVAGGFYRDHIVPRSAFHGLVDGDVGENCEQAARHHELLPADPVRECAHYSEERHPDQQGDCDHDVGGFDIHFQDGLHIEQRVKLPGIPDNALPRRRSEKGNQDEFQIRPFGEGILKRLRGGHS